MNRQIQRIAVVYLTVLPFMGAASRAVTLSEKEAVFWALETNTGIATKRISIVTDSLSLEQTRSGWLPSVTLNAGADYTPLNKTTAGTTSTEQASLEADFGISASQTVPGGGSINASVGQGIDRDDLDQSTTDYATSYSFSYNQPLLKGAWQNAYLDYTLKVSSLSHQQLSLSHQQQIISALSTIRSQYWSYYEKNTLVKVAANALDYASQQMEYEQNRFKLGQSTELDTLSAALELLRAKRDHLSAQTAALAARKELALKLMLAPESFSQPEDLEMTVGDLPEPEAFLAMVKQYDPELKIFELARQRLELAYRKDKNDLLPELSIGARYSRNLYGDEIFSDNISQSDNAVISVILSYTLPTKSRRLDLVKTKLDQDQNELEYKEYQLELKNQITDLTDAWQQEKLKLDIMEQSRAVASRQVEAARKGYQLGTVDRLELLKAENDFTQMSINYIQAQVSLKKLEIIFDEITGEILTKFGVRL